MRVLITEAITSSMSFALFSIVTYIGKQINNKTNVALAPALVETYCRLLVFSEIESLGVKGVLNTLFPNVFKQVGKKERTF